MADKNTTPNKDKSLEGYDPAPENIGSNQLNQNPETDSALDALLSQETAAVQPAETPAATETPGEEAPKAAESPAEEPKTTEKPAEEPKSTEKPADAQKKPGDASFVDNLLKKDDAQKPADTPKAEEDPFDKVKLRSDASQKTKDTFEQLKKEARERLAAEKAERERIAREYEEFKAKAPVENKLPEDVEKELKELREFRATFDIERDPEFQKKFDTRKSENYESIYSVLKGHQLPDSEIEVLRKMSEDERMEAISDLLEKLPQTSRLKIQAKFVENVSVDDERNRALSEARSRADTILKERAAEPAKKQESFYNEVATHAKNLASSVEFFNKVEIAPDTPPAEKARLEKQNKVAAQLQDLYVRVLADESPKAKAESALGLVYAHQLRSQLDDAQARVQQLEKEIADIKKASSVGNKGLITKPTTNSQKSRPVSSLSAGENLDRLYQEAMQG